MLRWDRTLRSMGEGPPGQTAKRPECPKSDKLSPFRAFCIVQGQIYVACIQLDLQWLDAKHGL